MWCHHSIGVLTCKYGRPIPISKSCQAAMRSKAPDIGEYHSMRTHRLEMRRAEQDILSTQKTPRDDDSLTDLAAIDRSQGCISDST